MVLSRRAAGELASSGGGSVCVWRAQRAMPRPRAALPERRPSGAPSGAPRRHAQAERSRGARGAPQRFHDEICCQ